MHVQAILQTKGTRVVSTRAGETIAATARLLAHHNIGAVVVLDDDGKLVGIISERDLVRGLAANGPAVAAQTVGEHMTRSVLSCQSMDTIQDIMAVMTSRRIRHLPVLEDGKLLGIVSIGDVVKHRLDEAALEVDSLRQYVLAGR